MNEKFRWYWSGWIKSSEGYAIRMGGRTGIDYRDEQGDLRIDAERMSRPGNEFVVYTRSIPDTPARPRSQVLERLERACEFARLILTLVDA
jgi:hypothetical protein